MNNDIAYEYGVWEREYRRAFSEIADKVLTLEVSTVDASHELVLDQRRRQIERLEYAKRRCDELAAVTQKVNP